MLPFLKKEASVSQPIDSTKRKPDEEPAYDSLQSAAEELVSAIHAKDISAVASALRSAFELCDASPHEEGEHV